MIAALLYGFLTVIGFIIFAWLLELVVEWFEQAEGWQQWMVSTLFFSVVMGIMYYCSGVQ